MAIIDVIKHEISDTELVGKFKSDNIKIGSQLIVYPSQTAFFVKGGKIFLTSSLKKHAFYNLLINNILYLCVT